MNKGKSNGRNAGGNAKSDDQAQERTNGGYGDHNNKLDDLATNMEDAGGELEDMGERWQKAKTRIRDLDLSESDDDSSPLASLLALAAGVAATYFLTSERAGSVRSRVQDAAADVRRRATDAAADVRRRATDQWDKFQRGGFKSDTPGTESRTASTPPDEVPPSE